MRRARRCGDSRANTEMRRAAAINICCDGTFILAARPLAAKSSMISEQPPRAIAQARLCPYTADESERMRFVQGGVDANGAYSANLCVDSTEMSVSRYSRCVTSHQCSPLPPQVMVAAATKKPPGPTAPPMYLAATFMSWTDALHACLSEHKRLLQVVSGSMSPDTVARPRLFAMM